MISRRSFLKGAAGASAIPLLSSWPKRALAQSVTFPKRLIIYYTANGVNAGAWFPTPGSNETNYTMSRTHAPLAPYRNRLLITSGIDMVTSDDGPGSGHQRGMGTVLTARPLLAGNFIDGCGAVSGWGSGISVDQRIAQVIGGETRFGSLQVGTRCFGGEVRTRISYLGSEQPLPPENDPVANFDRLFGEFRQEQSELQRIRNRRRSVLDAATANFAQIRSALGREDKEKLDRHLDFIRDIERRLAAQVLPGDACEVPPSPMALPVDDEATMPEISRLQMDLIAAALACDLTRVVTFQMGESINAHRYPWVNSFTEGHSLSHSATSDMGSQEELIRRDIWHAEQFAYLLSRLDAVAEDGNTVLDNTAVLWITDVAVGNTHSHANMPFLIAGGGGGMLRTGRFVQFNDRPHNDLLLTLLRLMDVQDATFGRPDMTPNVLSALLV